MPQDNSSRQPSAAPSQAPAMSADVRVSRMPHRFKTQANKPTMKASTGISDASTPEARKPTSRRIGNEYVSGDATRGTTAANTNTAVSPTNAASVHHAAV